MKIPNYQNKKWLYQKYITEGLSTLKIAPLLNCGKSTIQIWLEKFDIPRRHGGPIGAKKPFVMSNFGYKLIYKPGHPRAKYKRYGGHKTPNPYVPEQILVMENIIGRYLTIEELVHHKDGDRLNNNPSNLQLFPNHTTHMTYEKLLSSFLKQLLWGKIKISNRQEIFSLFKTFIKEHGQDIST